MKSITTGYGWSLVTEPLIFTGEVDEQYVQQAAELGSTVAATLMN